jgi:hypothetical protein
MNAMMVRVKFTDGVPGIVGKSGSTKETICSTSEGPPAKPFVPPSPSLFIRRAMRK